MTVESAHASLMTRASLGLLTSYVAPERELETTIAEIFSRVFGIDQVGADDDFFDVGGDSLSAEIISLEILKQTGHEFPMSDFIQFPTPRKIAASLENKPATGIPEAAATDAKARPPIFVVHGRGGYTMPAAQFRAALAEGQTLRMFELPGIRGGQYYERIEDIAGAYIDQIYQEHPRGPILLGSFCAGALIAIEMANQLAERGRPVAHLVLCDPPVRKNGTLGVGTDKLDLQDGLKALLLHLLPRTVSLRYYELRWRKRGRTRFADQNLSATARAKLYAAYIEHRIRPYSGEVTVLTSRARYPAIRDGSQVASLLPNRTVHLVVERHGEITSEPRAAELMQEAFDAALKSAGVPNVG